MWDTTSIKIKYKLPKCYVVLVYDEKKLRHFWRVAIVTGVLRSRNSETKRSDSEKQASIPSRNSHKYHDTNQTDNARERKLRWETAVSGTLKRKYDC